jgi:hypothetical protein
MSAVTEARMRELADGVAKRAEGAAPPADGAKGLAGEALAAATERMWALSLSPAEFPLKRGEWTRVAKARRPPRRLTLCGPAPTVAASLRHPPHLNIPILLTVASLLTSLFHPPSGAQATERRRKLDASGGGFSLLSWMSRCLPKAPTLNRTTPLSYAVRLGRPEVVAVLLAHSVAEVNAPDAWLAAPPTCCRGASFEYFEFFFSPPSCIPPFSPSHQTSERRTFPKHPPLRLPPRGVHSDSGFRRGWRG